MKNKKLTLLLIALIIITQRFLYQIADFEFYQIPFASSLTILQNQTGNIALILYAYLPIPFILFYFSERGHELTIGYGKLLIIRSYKRGRLYLKTVKTCAIELLIIVFYQTILFLPSKKCWGTLNLDQFFLILVTYYLGLLTIVALQLYFDFLFESSFANLFTNLFFIVSIFIGNFALTTKHFNWLGVVLFPNLLFGTRNGLISQKNIYIDYKYSITILCTAFILFLLLTILKFKKKDIY